MVCVWVSEWVFVWCFDIQMTYFMRWWSGVLFKISGCWWPALPEWLFVLALPIVPVPCDEFNVCVCDVCITWEFRVLWAVVQADGSGRDLMRNWKKSKQPIRNTVQINREFSLKKENVTMKMYVYLMLRWLPFRVSVFICGVPGHVWPKAFI